MAEHKAKNVLPYIIAAQFFCTSLWFAGNAVIVDVIKEFGLPQAALGHIISSVQFGFIIGTLLFAIFTISDRFSPSKVFVTCAVLGAVFNLAIFFSTGFWTILCSRFVTGFCLAGIYPVGMKIASDYYDKSLGKALGYLLGALVLGTALPHLLKGLMNTLPWQSVIVATSILATIGGIAIVLLVPDGPCRTKSKAPDFKATFKIFANKNYRSVVFGYFGHMWELYTFWAFVPLILTVYAEQNAIGFNIPVLSFLVIAVGALSCIVGGYISMRIGNAKTAFIALSVSFVCCLFSPMLFLLPPFFFMAYMFVWGMAVIADSPQFSTLIAQAANPETKGTALTIGNSIGFFITIISIQYTNSFLRFFEHRYVYLMLAIGPLLGLIAMRKLITKPPYLMSPK
jgi:predicted MFS family arabinose efflux permease